MSVIHHLQPYSLLPTIEFCQVIRIRKKSADLYANPNVSVVTQEHCSCTGFYFFYLFAHLRPAQNHKILYPRRTGVTRAEYAEIRSQNVENWNFFLMNDIFCYICLPNYPGTRSRNNIWETLPHKIGLTRDANCFSKRLLGPERNIHSSAGPSARNRNVFRGGNGARGK